MVAVLALFKAQLSFWYEMTTGTEVKIAFASFYVLIFTSNAFFCNFLTCYVHIHV